MRPHVGFEIRDGRVEVAEGSVLVDPGAYAHDPHRTFGPLLDASERGKPPFPRRPVVVFLGCEPARRRLAATAREPAGAPRRRGAYRAARRRRGCASDPAVRCRREASIRALAPDVVVTLDDVAAANVDALARGRPVHGRGRLRPGALRSDGARVVADRARGRPAARADRPLGRRGRVLGARRPAVRGPASGSAYGPPAAARHAHARSRALGRRFAGGRFACDHRLRRGHGRDRRAGRGACRRARRQPRGRRRARGGHARTHPRRRCPEPGSCCSSGVTPTPELDAVIAQRERAGLPTVLDLGPADLEAADLEAEPWRAPSVGRGDRARRLVRPGCGAGRGAAHAGVRRGPARARDADAAHPFARGRVARRAVHARAGRDARDRVEDRRRGRPPVRLRRCRRAGHRSDPRGPPEPCRARWRRGRRAGGAARARSRHGRRRCGRPGHTGPLGRTRVDPGVGRR